jgi:PadR family transcriptional regulator PadR
VRRKTGALVPLEISILSAAVDLAARGAPRFHGFLLAKDLKERDGARSLTAHGTLYKALDRLEKAGLLASFWEDPNAAADENRPRRRFYIVTPAGERALASAAPQPLRGQPELAMRPSTP